MGHPPRLKFPRDRQNLSSPSRDRTCALCIANQIPNYSTAREDSLSMFFTKSVIISYVCVYYPQMSISVSKFSLLQFHFSCGPRTVSQFCRLKILRKFEHITLHIIHKLPHPFFFHKGSHICPFIYVFLTANSPCQVPLAHNQTITVTS